MFNILVTSCVLSVKGLKIKTSAFAFVAESRTYAKNFLAIWSPSPISSSSLSFLSLLLFFFFLLFLFGPSLVIFDC